jgi:hypothetical protein
MGSFGQMEMEKRVEDAKIYIQDNWNTDEMNTALNATMDSSLANDLEEQNSPLIIVLFDSSYEEALNQLLLSNS